MLLCAPVTQSGLECHPPKVEVAGSNPVGSIGKLFKRVFSINLKRGWFSGRIFGFQPNGRGSIPLPRI
tara:strand:+ start:2015 stop:2218 length:204 start_codon:yes stop_codon:yes gene_type:complete